MAEEKNLTGYPSIDKPWLKYYKPGAEEAATNIPAGKTVWDVIEEKLLQCHSIPAIEYFGRIISREEFIENVYLWARVFKRLGVKENEIVAYYGPFMPDICYITFALNIIGACPYFLKLAISQEALSEETKDCRIAIVFDQMWNDVKREFVKDKYETVIIARLSDAMPFPKKQLVSALFGIKSGHFFPRGKKYISVLKARELAEEYDGEVRIPYASDRNAFITSSSGTTVGGIVKGIIATNETAIHLIYSEIASEMPIKTGDRVLNHFPPTAATSILSLFLMPLFCEATIIMDPRVNENDFYNQIIKLKPNVVITTGSAWEAFFIRLINETRAGRIYSFPYASYWIVGGEGSDVSKFRMWDEAICNLGGDALFSGYGQSELFSTVTVENHNARYDFSRPIMSVGIPIAGLTVGIFDKSGQELGYCQRGELRMKSKSAMKGYYNKPKLTEEIKIDGWIRSGDLAEIDENGFVYIWGRCNDKVILADGREIYLFDIANAIKENEHINDAIVVQLSTTGNSIKLGAHIVWADNPSEAEKTQQIYELNENLRQFLPDEISLIGYAEHKRMLPYSPTTLKKDKNLLSRQTDGYFQVVDGKIVEICPEP